MSHNPIGTLLLVHGGPGFDDSYFYPYLDSLSRRVNVVSYTQKREASLSELCNELNSRINEYSASYVLGHSWGGMLLLETLSRFSELKLEGLILVSTPIDKSCHDPKYDQSKSWNKRTVKSTANSKDEAFKNSCLESLELFFSPDYINEGESVFNKIAYSEKSFSHFFPDYILNFDLSPVLSRVTIPVLNIYGSEDLRIHRDHTSKMELLNKHIKNFEIRRAGHFPFVEQNKIFCEAVEKFIGIKDL